MRLNRSPSLWSIREVGEEGDGGGFVLSPRRRANAGPCDIEREATAHSLVQPLPEALGWVVGHFFALRISDMNRANGALATASAWAYPSAPASISSAAAALPLQAIATVKPRAAAR